MKIFKFGSAIAITTALMTAQPLVGATGRAAGSVVTGQSVGAVPDTGSTLALLLLSFFALMVAARLASFKKRKVV
jgi:hypothetical protein